MARIAELKRSRQIRINACSLSLETIKNNDLFVKTDCKQPNYFELLEECECANHSHRKKGCDLKGMGYCPGCYCAMPRGLIYCEACEDASDATMKLRSDFFLANFADRAQDQQAELF